MASTNIAIKAAFQLPGAILSASAEPFEQADVTNGNSYVNDQFPVFVFVKSAHGCQITIPVTYKYEGDLTVAPRIISVPAGSDFFFVVSPAGHSGFEGDPNRVGLLFSAAAKVSVVQHF